MASLIKDLTKEHIEKFGIEPNIIGMYWRNPEIVEDGIEEALENDEPYDEYNLLSPNQKLAYDEGELFF